MTFAETFAGTFAETFANMIGRRYKAFLILAGLIATCMTAARAADTITGVVRNQTRGQAAVGDEVILLRLNTGSQNPGDQSPIHLNQSTQEEARATTDAQGSFALSVQYPGAPHLLRVVHQGVDYDRPVSAGDGNTVDVFDATARVQGISATVEILRIGSNGNSLHVCDMIEIRNDSTPPRTQSGDRAFEVYLPTHARIDSVLAASSVTSSSAGSGTGSSAGSPAAVPATAAITSASPVPGEPGHYSVRFPLKPGATKFAFNYDLPYDGHATFRPRSIYRLQQLAVMIPPTMRFTSRSSAFLFLHTGNDRYQVEAANLLQAGAGPEFEISGLGALPALRAQSQASPKPPMAAQSVPSVSASSSPRSAAPSANNIDSGPSSGLPAHSSQLRSQPTSQLPRSVLAISAIAFCGFALLLWRGHRLSRNERMLSSERMRAARKPALKSEDGANAIAPPAEVFRLELLRLEIDRSIGAVTGKEYAAAKEALEETVKRALARTGTG
jgi:hypothetical protein